MAKKKFYAVARGRKPGIYESWAECEKQTNGFSGARFKSFPTRDLAQAFIGGKNTSTPTTAKLPTKAEVPRDSDETMTKRPAKRQRTEAASDSHVMSRTGCVTIDVHFDGGSRGNPGSAGSGAHIVIASKEDESGQSVDKQTIQVRKYLSRATNNIAEYQGLISGLQEAKHVALNFKSTTNEDIIHLNVRGDSDLIIQQMNGTYQCKSKNLMPLHKQAKSLVTEMKSLAPMNITFEHVYREDNSVADALANEAMDEKRSWTTTDNDDSNDSDGSGKERRVGRVVLLDV